ncbi:hypothetical protein CO046_04380 [Candidatus Peregrinibacteria bacterium CG_4_9_14_0_2_um_filter_53_11]|nr:MAG: hypothetical protein CO046_04380 [Candidatus Peregrinibacteria bacterium CG_4_9_14_0_2_um_filter_53_11]
MFDSAVRFVFKSPEGGSDTLSKNELQEVKGASGLKLVNGMKEGGNTVDRAVATLDRAQKKSPLEAKKQAMVSALEDLGIVMGAPSLKDNITTMSITFRDEVNGEEVYTKGLLSVDPSTGEYHIKVLPSDFGNERPVVEGKVGTPAEVVALLEKGPVIEAEAKAAVAAVESKARDVIDGL